MEGTLVMTGGAGPEVLDWPALVVLISTVALDAGRLQRAIGGRLRYFVTVRTVTLLREGRRVVRVRHVAVGADIRAAGALVAGRAVTIELAEGPVRVVVNLGHRRRMAVLTAIAVDLDACVAICAVPTDRLGLFVVAGVDVTRGADDILRLGPGMTGETLVVGVGLRSMMTVDDLCRAGREVAGCAIERAGVDAGMTGDAITHLARDRQRVMQLVDRQRISLRMAAGAVESRVIGADMAERTVTAGRLRKLVMALRNRAARGGVAVIATAGLLAGADVAGCTLTAGRQIEGVMPLGNSAA